MIRPRARAVGPFITVPAGSWRAADNQLVKLRRIPSPPQAAYQRLVSVPIGNDGIAFPVIFGAGGGAQAFAGPSGVGAAWQPAQANIYTSVGQLDSAVCALYVGPLPIQQYQAAANLIGGGTQFALGGIGLVPGWFVWAIWTGGTPGATGYLIVSGTKTALAI